MTKTLCSVFCVLYCFDSVHAGNKPDITQFRRFASEVKYLVQKARPVLENRGEAGDVRALDFHLRDFNECLAAGRWRDAVKFAERMRVPLIRVREIVNVSSQRAFKRQQRFAKRESRIQILKVKDAILSAQSRAAAAAAFGPHSSRAARRELNRLNDEIRNVRSELDGLREKRSNEKKFYNRLLRSSRA